MPNEKPDLNGTSTFDLVGLMAVTGESKDPSDIAFHKACQEELKRRKSENHMTTAELVKKHNQERSMNSSNHSYKHYEELLAHCIQQDIELAKKITEAAQAVADATTARQANANYRRENDIAISDTQKATHRLKEVYDKQVALARSLSGRVLGVTEGLSIEELGVAITHAIVELENGNLNLCKEKAAFGKAKEIAETRLFDLEHPAATHRHADGGLYALVDDKAVFHEASSNWVPAAVYKTMKGVLACRRADNFDDRFTPLTDDEKVMAPRVNCPEREAVV